MGGFQALRKSGAPRFPDAASPSGLRQLLEPSVGVPAVTSNVLGNALGHLDEVADRLVWRSIPDGSCAQDLAFALALDKRAAGAKARLRAIVCRTFARADEYAVAFQREMTEATNLEEIAKRIDSDVRASAAADAERGRLEEIFGKSAGETVEQLAERLEAVRQAAAVRQAEQLRQRDQALSIARTSPATTDSDPRYFLVLRLAEIFAVAVAEPVTFHAREPKKAPGSWLATVTAALAVTGLTEGRQTLDTLLRRLGGRGDYADLFPGRDAYLTEDLPQRLMSPDEVAQRARAEGAWRPFREEPMRLRDLESSGYEGEFGLGAPPADWPAD